jgi:ectoine hydroxylase-related dioxygenase (phytanoyl-CoA dioxygenase family)
MRLSTSQIQQYHEHGYLVLEHFLEAKKLAAAQAQLHLHYPTPASIPQKPERIS